MASTLNHEELGRADEKLARLEEQLSKLGHDTARHPSDPQTRMNTFRLAVSGDRPPLGGWARRGFTAFLLAACIGVAAITWRQSYSGDAVKTAPPQPAPPAQTAPTATALSPELTELRQSMARDLATVGQGIEQLRASQEQMARDNADVAEQLKASQEQLARLIAQVSEQNARPRVAAPPPRPAATPTPKPVPTLSSPQAPAKPQAGKPQLSSASPRPVPVR
jgi:hypothetical protein